MIEIGDILVTDTGAGAATIVVSPVVTSTTQIYSVTLPNNEITAIVLGTVARDRAILLNYTLVRNAKMKEGEFRILSDGSSVYYKQDNYQDNGEDVGVVLIARIAGANIEIVATVASDVYDVEFKYRLEAIPVGVIPIAPAYPQYVLYADDELLALVAPVIYDDSFTQVRRILRAGVYSIDISLTPDAFTGTEGVDWIPMDPQITGATAIYRYGSRDGKFVVDCTITATGFGGSEGQDWIQLSSTAGGGVLTLYRDGVRDGAYVIDKALTVTGFAGTEGQDWENLRKYKPI